MTNDKNKTLDNTSKDEYSDNEEKENIPEQAAPPLIRNSSERVSFRCSSPTQFSSLKKDEVLKKRLSNPGCLSYFNNTADSQKSDLICNGQSVMWSTQTYSGTDIYKMSSTPKYIKLQNLSSNDESLLKSSDECVNSDMLEIIGFKKEQCVKCYFVNNRLENGNFSVNIPISFEAAMSRIYEPNYYYPTLRSLTFAGPRFAIVTNLQQTYVDKLIIPENVAFELLRNNDNSLIIEKDCLLVKFPDKYRKLPLSLCGRFFPISSPEKNVLSQLVNRFPFPQIINFGDIHVLKKAFSFLRHSEENMILTDVFTQCLIVAKPLPQAECNSNKYLIIPCFNAELDRETKFRISDIIKVNSHYPHISSSCGFGEEDSVAVMNVSRFATIKDNKLAGANLTSSFTEIKSHSDQVENRNAHNDKNSANSGKIDPAVINDAKAITQNGNHSKDVLFTDPKAELDPIKSKLNNVFNPNDTAVCDNETYLSGKIENNILNTESELLKNREASQHPLEGHLVADSDSQPVGNFRIPQNELCLNNNDKYDEDDISLIIEKSIHV